MTPVLIQCRICMCGTNYQKLLKKLLLQGWPSRAFSLPHSATHYHSPSDRTETSHPSKLRSHDAGEQDDRAWPIGLPVSSQKAGTSRGPLRSQTEGGTWKLLGTHQFFLCPTKVIPQWTHQRLWQWTGCTTVQRELQGKGGLTELNSSLSGDLPCVSPWGLARWNLPGVLLEVSKNMGLIV